MPKLSELVSGKVSWEQVIKDRAQARRQRKFEAEIAAIASPAVVSVLTLFEDGHYTLSVYDNIAAALGGVAEDWKASKIARVEIQST